MHFVGDAQEVHRFQMVDAPKLVLPLAFFLPFSSYRVKHGVQIKVLELFSSFSRFLIKFPYYSSGFEIKVCHSN